jgi:hypothetical protein
MQAVTTVLNWCGIKRSVHRRRIEGGVLRIYRIDQERLAFLQTLLVQRGETDPALLLNNQVRGAGSDHSALVETEKMRVEQGECRKHTIEIVHTHQYRRRA